jgi:hypothetical protein
MVQLCAGKLDEARKIYDRLVDSDEANVDRAAENRFARATISSLQFRITEALPDLCASTGRAMRAM